MVAGAGMDVEAVQRLLLDPLIRGILTLIYINSCRTDTEGKREGKQEDALSTAMAAAHLRLVQDTVVMVPQLLTSQLLRIPLPTERQHNHNGRASNQHHPPSHSLMHLNG